MAEQKFYPEDVLVQMMQEDEKCGWLFFVNHYSPEWQDEYLAYCKKKGVKIGEESAEAFASYKDSQLEYAMMDSEEDLF